MKSRKELAEYFAKLGFNRGAEVGVLGGGYSMILCGSNPSLQLSCIDSWGKGDVKLGAYHRRKLVEAKERLAPFNVTFIQERSLDAVKMFEDASLDFVYIDANHSFDNVMQDIMAWAIKVRRNGILSGHDYGGAVKDAVDVYAKWHKLNVQVTGKDRGGVSWWMAK